MKTLAAIILVLASLPVRAGLTLSEPKDGSVLRASAVLVRGMTSSNEPISCAIRGETHSVQPQKGQFAIPIELKGGANSIVFTQGTDKATLLLSYVSSQSPMRVSFVVVVPQGSDGSPTLETSQRIDTVAKLWQCALADRMPTRQTFQLQLNPEGKVKAHSLTLGFDQEKLAAMSFGQLTAMLYPIIEAKNPGDTCKTIVILPLLSFGPSSPVALGGGSIVFVAGSAMQNWETTGTELGTIFLELLKTFGAQDTGDPTSILGQPEALAALFAPGHDQKIIPDFAVGQLELCPWLMPDFAVEQRSAPPDLKLSADGRSLQVHSDAGLGFVGWYQGSEPIMNSGRIRLANPGVKFVDVPAVALRTREGQPPVRLVAIDKNGNRTDRVVSDLVHLRTFLTQWQITTRPIPWAEAPMPRKFDDEAIADLVTKLQDKPHLELEIETVVSFGLEFQQNGPRLAYALSNYVAEEGGTKSLSIRPDDNARVWVNRKLVLDKIGVTAASTNRVLIQLLPGANEILVETEPDLSGRAFSIWLDDAS